jgi:hypothetical protein
VVKTFTATADAKESKTAIKVAILAAPPSARGSLLILDFRRSRFIGAT